MEGVRVLASNRGIDPPGEFGCIKHHPPGESVTCDQRHYGRGSPRAVHPSGYTEVEQVGGLVVKGKIGVSGEFKE